MFMKLRPARIVDIKSAPKAVPIMYPLPPARLIPPRTVAAMASSSQPVPASGTAALLRDAKMTPFIVQRIPAKREHQDFHLVDVDTYHLCGALVASNRNRITSKLRPIEQVEAETHNHQSDDNRQEYDTDVSLSDKQKTGSAQSVEGRTAISRRWAVTVSRRLRKRAATVDCRLPTSSLR